MAARVDVWDPTSEGPWIVERLRISGLDVGAVDLAEVPLTRADLLVMAGDVEGALGALKLLRDEGARGDVPVVLLGVPAGTSHRGDGPGFGADAVFVRPVDLEPLLARVLSLLAGRSEISRVHAPVAERTMQLSDPDDPESSQVLVRVEEEPSQPGWRPREPTMQLSDLSDVSEVKGRSQRSSEGSSADSVVRSEGSGSARISSFPGTGSRPGTGRDRLDAPEPDIPEDQRAALSPWLEELLHAADRRVFPDRPPLAMHLLAANEPPEELVPAELIEGASFRIDEPAVEDPIDAFTYVGGPIVPPPVQAPAAGEEGEPLGSRGGAPMVRAQAHRPISAEGPPQRSLRHEVTTATELPALTREPHAPRGGAWPDDEEALGRSLADGTRRGTLGEGGALRLLWRLASLGLDGICELQLADGPLLRMTLLAGELKALDGPVATTALAGLRRRGRATERPADEVGAEAALQARVDAGTLGRFERDRLLSEARERLLVDAVAASRADFVLRRLDDTQPGRVLARSRMMRRPLRAALVDAARDALDVERVTSLLGKEPSGLALGPESEAGLAPAELSTELIELLVRLDGRRLLDFLVAAPTEPGLAGALYALVAGGALVLTDPPGGPVSGALSSVVELVNAASERATDADYFTILGLDAKAGGPEIERAHRARREELVAIPLHALGLERLAHRRDEAVEAVDEAYRVLRDADRRRRYAAASGPFLSH